MPDRAAENWKRYGETDPYFGVCSDATFGATRLDAAARERFFESGEAEVAATLATLRAHFAAAAARSPRRALDFGCGVARLTIPLARAAERVVGVDVSPGMLAEARTNCERAGVANAEFVLSDAALGRVEGTFDLVHSYIVFQHIPPKRGYALLDAILERLAAGGVGMLHFTYARDATLLRRAVHAARRSVPLVNLAANVAQRRPARAPMMAMYAYDLNRVIRALGRAGCGRVYAVGTDHGGHLGAMLFFDKTVRPLTG